MRAYTQMRSAIADRWARASSRGWDEMRNSELSLRGWLRILLVSLFAVFVLTVPSAFSAETPTEVPSSLVAPLGTDRQAAVVPYEDLLKVARKGQLNAATVDAARYWVAAVDENGTVIASHIPTPEAGVDFGARTPTDDALRASATPSAFDLADWLRARNVVVVGHTSGTPAESSTQGTIARSLIIPLGVATGFVIILIGMLAIRGRMGGGRQGGAAGHGKMRKNVKVTPPTTRFANVAGCDEAVDELREVVSFLKSPLRFSRVGARMPRGIILWGPPGTGKTLLARAVAGEAGVPFYAVSGSDFVDTFVGVGASRVRDLFNQAREQEDGAIVFFDEVDAIGRQRGSGAGGADSEREATLNQLLVELDGFGQRDRIVVIAATNRVDMLDQALTRPGRFDRRVQVGLPAEAGRREILGLYAADKPLEDSADLDRIATVTAGFSGADLSNLLNEAAIMAARDERTRITTADLDEGMLRALAGPQKRDRRMAEGELEVIAWHEAGHCLAAELCPSHQPTQRITILARGDAGGLALYGTEDRALTSAERLHERMVVAMAGRAAEQLRFGAVSSGAANDLEQVTSIARQAVEKLGFSSRVGQVTLTSSFEGNLSEGTRRTVEREVVAQVEAAYTDALTMLDEHRDELDRLAERLLAAEQLDRAEIVETLGDLVTRPLPSRRPRPIPVQAQHALPAPIEDTPRDRRRRRPRVALLPRLGGAYASANTFVRGGTRAIRMSRRIKTRQHLGGTG